MRAGPSVLMWLCLAIAGLPTAGGVDAKQASASFVDPSLPLVEPLRGTRRDVQYAANLAPPNPPPLVSNVTLKMIADKSVGVGSKVSFKVTARKRGYLLLVDVDATGKMSQIFPSPELLAQAGETEINLITPGVEVTIPSPAETEQGFQYVITPPTGVAAVVAILSEKRVQILDLPDLPQKLDTEADAIDYLTKWTNELRIPDVGNGSLQRSNWWFDIKSYAIK
jgi:hypothetical protein